ncbi:MAG: toll/interleukin-1 receptor domain-containing protein, partial [Ignavibacteria bacterium]|nr:toll/interleukin-1 receptor domain-containing protein [Ignavibacteria bacterium]
AYLDYSVKIHNQSISDAELFAKKLTENVTSLSTAPTLFLCHASEDKPFVDKLVNELDRHAYYAWYDKREIFVGDSIVEKINDGLKSADYLIVVLSSKSVNKPWVKRELNSSIMRQLSSESILILPILIEDCEIPKLLNDIKYADFRLSFKVGVNELIGSIRKNSK